ncbi:hypothetical protein [Lentzea sp. NPDC003310]|uniref:nSTAND1 domain-containing NTPase n=1 Tax=Lentzea sp. NPDC003310 TaxID=3154447 RepID=UPI0033BF540B
MQRFASELRELRRGAGGMPYRTLATRCGYAVSTVSDAAGGRRLPTLEVALAYVQACGGDAEEWTAKWKAAALAATREAPGKRCRAPYRGASAFREEDADLFFVREELVTEIVTRARENSITVVSGPSGAGKTSVLLAGVVPALRDELRPVVVAPGERLPGDGVPLVVLDRFEEVYTRCDQRAFLDGVRALVARRVRLVVAVRADFSARCVADLGASGQDVVRVEPMTPEELCAAVSRPAQAVGMSVERALLTTVATEARGGPGALPLLSHALAEAWRRRRGEVLTEAGFAAAGGVGVAVAGPAEAAYGDLGPEERLLAEQLLLRLVTVDEETGAAGRRRVPAAELAEVAAVVDRLAAARLVTVGEDTVEIAHDAVLAQWPRLRAWIDDDRDALRSHRAVTTATRTWLDGGQDATALATGARLEELRTHALSSRLRLSPSERAYLDASLAQDRRARAATRRRSRLLLAVSVVAVVCAAVAGSLAAVANRARLDAARARDTTVSRQIALTADKLRHTDPALAAQLAIAGYRTAATTEARSALLASSGSPLPARYLGGAGPTALAVSADGGLTAVSNALDGSVRLFVRENGVLARSGVVEPRRPETTGSGGRRGVMVYALALVPGRDVLAVGDVEGFVSLWDVSDPAAPVPFGAPVRASAGPVERLAADPSGRELAAAAGTAVPRWDVSDPANVVALRSLPAEAPVRTVTYGPGGLLAFGTDGGSVHLWDVRGGAAERSVVRAGDKPVPAVSISPDGRTLVAGSHDRTLRSWDVTTPAAPVPARSLAGEFDLKITTTAFSPDGRHLVAGGADATIRVLDAATWETLRVLPHPDVVTWAAFGADGSVVSTATDGAVRVWPEADAPDRHARGPVQDTAFSRDGTRLAVFAEGSAALWDPESLRPLGGDVPAPPTPFSGAGDLSADGTLLAAGTVGGDVEVVDVRDPARPAVRAVLGGSRQEVVAVAFSPDGSKLAAAGRDSAIRVWDLTGPRLVAVLDDPRDLVLDLAWNPRGTHLAAASGDSHVYLVSVTGTPRVVARLDGLDSYAFSATFSGSGDVLAAGGVDGEVLLWDVRDPASPRRVGPPLAGPAGRILELAFQPGGDLLAASVIDGSAWLWNVADPAKPSVVAVVSESTSPLGTAVFRPGGDRVFAGGGDGRLRTWRTDENAVAAAICATTGDPMTEHEWRAQFPDLAYAPPCR